MNINTQGFRSFSFGGGLLKGTAGLKSTQQRMERQEVRDRQVAFFENQKENLKNVKCESVEEIARKLELFHSYEDQIRAAKAVYNNEQMWHMMDESREIGEKIAEAVEKSKPKTAEERQEDLVEEITGTESGGIMDELDEVMEEALELQEELRTEQVQEAVKDAALEQAAAGEPGQSAEEIVSDAAGQAEKELASEGMAEYIEPEEALTAGRGHYAPNILYRSVDFRV